MSAYTQNPRFGSSVIVTVVCVLLFAAAPGRAACINKFTHRDRGPQHVITLLTGKLSFQDAQTLAAAIRDGKAAPLEWVESSGKTVAKMFGELKIVRPMPVACDNNPSGVIMIVTFPSVHVPEKKMLVKFGPTTTVEFEEQTE